MYQLPVKPSTALLVLMHFYDLDGKLSEIKRQLGQKTAGTAEA